MKVIREPGCVRLVDHDGTVQKEATHELGSEVGFIRIRVEIDTESEYDWLEYQAEEMDDEANFTIRCSFCGKTSSEVIKTIAGPTNYICNECIDLCNKIIREDAAMNSQFPTDLDSL